MHRVLLEAAGWLMTVIRIDWIQDQPSYLRTFNSDPDLALQDEKRLYVKNQEARGHSGEFEERPDEAPQRPPGGAAGAAQRNRKRLATSKSLDVETGGVEIFNENETALYCVCQQPYNVDTSMIECDSCHEWYHVKCVGLSQVSFQEALSQHLTSLSWISRGFF